MYTHVERHGALPRLSSPRQEEESIDVHQPGTPFTACSLLPLNTAQDAVEMPEERRIFETDFEFDEQADAVLKIENKGLTNRPKITAEEIRSTSFSANLGHVQYGTWKQKPAALLKFEFRFIYRQDSVKRITSATIRLSFEETGGPSFEPPQPRDPNNDPRIVFMAPVKVHGEVSTEHHKRQWNLSIPIKYQFFGAEAGIEASMGGESEIDRDHRMTIEGGTTSDDMHYYGDNIAIWTISENKMQKSGIIRRFPAALVIALPNSPSRPVSLRGLIRPYVCFTINPHRLLQRRDDPVYLDGEKETEDEMIAPGVDFADKAFPWQDIISIPSKYEDHVWEVDRAIVR